MTVYCSLGAPKNNASERVSPRMGGRGGIHANKTLTDKTSTDKTSTDKTSIDKN